MISDADLIKTIKERKKESRSYWAEQYKNIKNMRSIYEGDLVDFLEEIEIEGKKRLVQINKVQPIIDAVAGAFAQNRRQPDYCATIHEAQIQQEYSKGANALSDYCRANSNADQIETEMDMDMLIGGIGVSETAMSYGEGYSTTSPNGEILMTALDFLTVWPDKGRSKNLTDIRFVGVSKDYDLDEALELFDGEEDDFETQDPLLSDGGYKFDPNLGGNYDRIKYEYSNKSKQRINVDFYHWYEVDIYHRADNPLYTMTDPVQVMVASAELEAIAQEYDFDFRAQILDVSRAAMNRIKESFGDNVRFSPFRKRIYYSAVVSGDKVFSKTIADCQSGFKIKFKTGKRYENKGIFAGIVNSMAEPAIYYNKALTELMWVIACNSKGGYFVETDATNDVEELEATINQTDGIVYVNPGANSAGKIVPKKTPFIPTGYDSVIGISDQNFSDVSGIDKTFMGSSENKVEPAMLQRQRIRQTMTVLALYVDSIQLYQKEHARMMLDLMRIFAENNEGMIVRIMGADGAYNFMQISADPFAAEFDVVIQDAPMTPDEKEEKARTLFETAMPLFQMGDPAAKLILSKAIKYMKLDYEDQQEISQALTQPQQQQIDPAYVQQLEQMVQALQGEMTQAQVAELQSRAQLNMAKIGQTQAQTDKATADTMKAIQEGKQTGIENQILRMTGSKDIRVLT
jgi:hypothetical protein